MNAKSTLGSAYLVSSDGRLVTNYHVVGSYVGEPERYQLRAKNASGEFEARLLSFDLPAFLDRRRARGIA